VRITTDNLRVRLWGVVAVLLAAALLIAPAVARAAGPEIPSVPPIDTGKNVQPSQCAPCHLDLGTVNRPGLIFSHGNHLMVSCDGCHARMPHQNGGTESVPMEVCYACHGVQHGPQGELATSACRKCHSPSFKLTPADHTKGYAGKPHALAVKSTGINGCMMCHTAAKDCDACHEKMNLGLPKMPDTYASIVTERPRPPSVKIYPEGPTTMAQCSYCHPDLDKIAPGRLVFAHSAHLQRNYKCTVCHPRFGHSENGVNRPDMMSCYRCHGMSHGTQGLVAGDACAKCHPKSFNLIPANHTPAFKKGKHGPRANKDLSYCGMCHNSEFCVTCHTGKSTTPNASPTPVIPVGHTDPSWLGGMASCSWRRRARAAPVTTGRHASAVTRRRCLTPRTGSQITGRLRESPRATATSATSTGQSARTATTTLSRTAPLRKRTAGVAQAFTAATWR